MEGHSGQRPSILEVDEISNAYLRVIQVGDTITTTHFMRQYQSFAKENILGILDDLAGNPMPPQESQVEKPKAFHAYMLMAHDSLIDALQQDGYFD